MDLQAIVDELKGGAEPCIAFYVDGRVTRRSRHQVHQALTLALEVLEGAGVTRGQRIGVLANNSYAWLILDLAALSMRCQVVAFPEEFRTESQAALVEKYDLALLLTDDKGDASAETPHIGRLSSLVRHADALGSPAGSRASTGNLSGLKARPDAGCHVEEDYRSPSLVFSSGTSGRLKCMVTSRGGCERMIARFGELYELRDTDRALMFLPLSNFQQRLIAYGCYAARVELLLVEPERLLTGFRELKPTLFATPPLLLEAVRRRFENRLGWLATVLSFLSRFFGLLPRFLAQRLRRFLYYPVHQGLGGRVRLVLTGMAPVQPVDVAFFNGAGVDTYVVYGVTECGTVAANTGRASRPGSVGLPFEPGEVSLAPDGEILVTKRAPLTSGYLFVAADEARATYVNEHTVATGDIGRMDEQGFLYLLGRKKEIIISSSGHKIHPEVIEERLQRCPEILRPVVLATGRESLGVVVHYPPPQSSQREQRIREYVEHLNREGPAHARVQRVVFTNEDFSVENGLLTRNLKLARGAIRERFSDRLQGG